jgi:hypothetical protein
MKSLTKVLLASVMLSGAALAVAGPASAGVDVSIGIGGPGYYADYDYNRPCWFYRTHDLPAPRRCYDYFRGIWGGGIYVDGDFLFQDRDHWWRWHDRDDYHHWRNHDFHWHGDHGGRPGPVGHDHGGRPGQVGHDHGDHHGNDHGDHHDHH